MTRERTFAENGIWGFAETDEGGKRYTLDGFVTYRRDSDNRTLNNAYCLVFFNGVVESVYSDILRVEGGQKTKKGETAFIASMAYKRYLIEALRNYIKGYKALGIEAPVAISMSLLGCKGAYMYQPDSHPMDRDVAILPEVQLASFHEQVPTVMRPVFDDVWNASGLPCSYDYTENGTWNVRL
jgi:hypothetical protein